MNEIKFAVDYVCTLDAEAESRACLMDALDAMKLFYPFDAWQDFLLDVAAAQGKLMDDGQVCDACNRRLWLEEVDAVADVQLLLVYPDDEVDAVCWTCNEAARRAAFEAEEKYMHEEELIAMMRDET